MATIFTLHVGFADSYGNHDCVELNRSLLFSCINTIGFDGYTIIDSVGCYQGNQEPSANVIFIAIGNHETSELLPRVRALASLYKAEANQSEVLLTYRKETLEVL
jgi:hypothetical protein